MLVISNGFSISKCCFVEIMMIIDNLKNNVSGYKNQDSRLLGAHTTFIPHSYQPRLGDDRSLHVGENTSNKEIDAKQPLAWTLWVTCIGTEEWLSFHHVDTNQVLQKVNWMFILLYTLLNSCNQFRNIFVGQIQLFSLMFNFSVFCTIKYVFFIFLSSCKVLFFEPIKLLIWTML